MGPGRSRVAIRALRRSLRAGVGGAQTPSPHRAQRLLSGADTADPRVSPPAFARPLVAGAAAAAQLAGRAGGGALPGYLRAGLRPVGSPPIARRVPPRGRAAARGPRSPAALRRYRATAPAS